jgi:type VI secretion system protein ImpH
MTATLPSLRDRLGDEGYAFDFYQAVRLLELLLGKTVAADDPIRFRSRVSLAFPPSDVYDIRFDADGKPEVTVNFIGLAGVLGPLPTPLTEQILFAQGRSATPTPAVDFLDIFNHRLISLMYLVRQAHRPALTAQAPSEGLAAQCLFALIGLGLPSLRNRLKSEKGLLYYSGLLAARPRSAVGLERMLSDYFGVSARVRQFVGRWRKLDRRQWTVIGGPRPRNIRLGSNAVIGTRVWDKQSHIRIRLGPMAREKYLAILPGTDTHRTLCEMVRFYIDPETTFSISLRLEKDDAFTDTLGSGKLRLGFTSWLAPLAPEKTDKTTVDIEKDY